MKTEQEVKDAIATLKKELKATKANFKKYDCVDDMHLIEQRIREIVMLEWVLGNE